jgi:hypothetical protein
MKKIGKVLVIIVILGLISVFAFYTFAPLLMTYSFIKIHSHYVEKMSAATGLDTYLVNVLVALMVIPFLIGLKKFFALKSRQENRIIGGILLISVLIIYNGSLYYFTRDMYVSTDGRVMKYYDITDNGVVYSDKPGVNTRTGHTWKEVTPEMIPKLKLWEKGVEDFHSVDPSTARWFNPITGVAELWYYKHADGSFEFYNKPGYHPKNSERLIEVTQHIYMEWKKQEDERIEKLKASVPAAQNTPVPGDKLAPAEPESPAAALPSVAQMSPSQELQYSKVKVERSLVAEAFENNQPKGVSNSFPSGTRNIYYVVYYSGAAENKTTFQYNWYRNGIQFTEGQFVVQHSGGYAWWRHERNFEPGRYEVKLNVEGRELSVASFIVYENNGQPTAKSLASPRVAISQNSVDFGEIKMTSSSHEYSRQGSITITNAGDGDLVINRIIAPSYPFLITENDCSNRLKPMGECRIFVRFSPSTRMGNQNEVKLDRYRASIVIQSNAGIERISLYGSTMAENLKQRYYSVRPFPVRPRYIEAGRLYRRY